MARPRVFISLGLLSLLFLLALGAALWGAASANVSGAMRLLAVTSFAVCSLLLVNRLVKVRRLAETTQEQSEAYIAAVARMTEDIHLLLDPRDGVFLYVNAGACRFFGMPEEDLLAWGVEGLRTACHPEDQGVARDLMSGVGPQGEPGGVEPVREGTIRILIPGYPERQLLVRVMVFHREGEEPAEVLVVARDTTATAQVQGLQSQAAAFECFRSLVGGMVHDLNNVLMGVQLQAELPSKADAEKLSESTEKASGLARQLLAWAGGRRKPKGRHRLEEVVQAALGDMESRVPSSVRVDFQVQDPTGLPEVVLDRVQIQHAVHSLVALSLASLGGRQGTIQIRIRMVPSDTPEASRMAGGAGRHVCLEVEDGGGGLPDHTLRALVLPGLLEGEVDSDVVALHWVARSHHGVVEGERLPSGGFRGRLRLPLDAAESVAAPDEGARPLTGDGRVVLLVEDEAVLRDALHIGLVESGFQVLEAKDGVEGLAVFVRNQDRIAAVLLDLTMPRMNGDVLFGEIHRLNPKVPVVLMSGYGEADATLDLGGLSGFLSKPSSLRAVREALAKALGTA